MSEERSRRQAEVTPLRKVRPCPECARPSTRADYPFCSQHCRDLDLGRWLSGTYAIVAREGNGQDDAAD